MHAELEPTSARRVRAAARGPRVLVAALIVGLAGGALLGACGDMTVPVIDDAPEGGADALATDAFGDEAVDAGPADGAVEAARRPRPNCSEAGPTPDDLECTGLYSNWDSKAIAADVKAYKPGVEYWTDGALKDRWIWLPAGKKIDTSNPNEWQFPVGTKLWQEIRLKVGTTELRIETRYAQKIAIGIWYRSTFLWSRDQQSAVQEPGGAANVFGTGYDVPEQQSCNFCHAGRADFALGFEAVLLSHPDATGLTVSQLGAGGLTTDALDAGDFAIPGSAGEKAALAYLHVNCGVSCHNRNPSSLGYPRTGLILPTINQKMFMRLDWVAVVDGGSDRDDSGNHVPPKKPPLGPDGQFSKTDVAATVLDRVLHVYDNPPVFATNSGCRIQHGSTSTSAVVFRMESRLAAHQMPPTGTKKRDPDGEKLIESWITSIDTGPTDCIE